MRIRPLQHNQNSRQTSSRFIGSPPSNLRILKLHPTHISYLSLFSRDNLSSRSPIQLYISAGLTYRANAREVGVLSCIKQARQGGSHIGWRLRYLLPASFELRVYDSLMSQENRRAGYSIQCMNEVVCRRVVMSSAERREFN